MDDPLSDKRFSHVVNDRRFRSVPRKERKIKIDNRFKAMFTDDKFKLKYAVDKRGRPVNQTQSDNLKKYYELASGSEDGSDDEDKSGPPDMEVVSEDSSGDEQSTDEDQNQVEKSVSSSLAASDSDKDSKKPIKLEDLKERSIVVDNAHKMRMNEVTMEKLKDLTVDYARGIGTLGSDDSSSDESSSEDSADEEIVHPWGELDKDAETTEDATKRLAACNMDWDRITAKDLFVLFTSFLPPEGFIESVTIYPSDFGVQRMKEEEMKGPKELCEKSQQLDDDDFPDKRTEDDQYCMEKLREYQLNRLKYYYAVITYDSIETADKIYKECDGIEYESSATKLDLRFIPDDMEFDQEPKETCTSLPDITKYKPRLFVNSALQQGTVNLTWDETDPNRVEFTKKLAGGEKINEDDLQAYIAASSDDASSDVEEQSESENKEVNSDDPITKYKALLSSVASDNKKHKPKVDMEVSWGVGLGGKHNVVDSDDETDDLDANSAADADSDDVDNTISIKKKTVNPKKAAKCKVNSNKDEGEGAELQLLLAEDGENVGGKKHFNFKDIQKQEKLRQKKRKFQKNKKQDGRDVEDNFEIDVNDSRFSALYTSHHFNIDPADPHFVRTGAAEKIINEKQKRRKLINTVPETKSKSEKLPLNRELASLVKSIKGKRPRS